MKAVKILSVILVLLFALLGCEAKRTNEDEGRIPSLHSTPEIVPTSEPRTYYDFDIEEVTPLESPLTIEAMGPYAYNFEKLMAICKYAVYGDVKAVKEACFYNNDNEPTYFTVLDFDIMQDYSPKPIKDKSIRIHLFDSSYKHDECWPLFKTGDMCLLLINDASVDCFITTVCDMAPYRIPNYQCVLTEKYGTIDVSQLNKLLSESDKPFISVPCTDPNIIGDLLMKNAKQMKGLSILSVYSED